ncbi:hypothetical protein [Candidatus Mesenet endosymbiont of Agriotes lineatus]|uniref:hypothetical protein n=1 Tax=Candidatus Mesenet endosymbiont of Agriotes lineatus TaxID=3077948 RepID=UPI0030CCB658
MSKFLANINSNSKPEDSQIVNWEVIKNREYYNNSLSKIINLYIIKTYEPQNNEFLLGSKHYFNTALVRIIIARENILLNKLLTIEIMKEIFPDRFNSNSKKRSNMLHLQDLYSHLCYTLNAILSKDMEENFIKEYKDAVSLFKS